MRTSTPSPRRLRGARRLLGAVLLTAARAWQDPNATAKIVSVADTCVGVPCGGRGPCNPRFLAAGPNAVIDPSTLWVVTVKRVRRATASDWANMEHFAASTLPAYEELYRQRIKVDKLALPQVMRPRAF